MNKKRNRIIRVASIVALVVLFVIVMAVFSIKSADESAQFSQGENTDVMDFNPFIENESRLDNSLLEYGKVLNKYYTDNIPDYTGEAIVMEGTSYAEVSGGSVSGFTEDYYHEASDSLVEADPTAVIVADGTTTLVYKFKADKTALYSLKLEYFMPEDKSNAAFVSFTVKEKKPFLESSNIELGR